MALLPQTVKDITDKVSEQYLELLNAVTANLNDDYFPLITQDDDYGFELKLMPYIAGADDWNMTKLVKVSPISYIINGLNSYFSHNPDYTDVGYPGSLDNYLYVNDLTVYKYFADAQYIISGYKMAGTVVENTDVFIFAEFGIDYDAFFTSLNSYTTSEDLNAEYGVYETYTSFAPTDQVEVEIVNGTINFDIQLICKDKNGDVFVHSQNINGITGDKIQLSLVEKITGCSGLVVPYEGNEGDLMRIQTIAPEV